MRRRSRARLALVAPLFRPAAALAVRNNALRPRFRAAARQPRARGAARDRAVSRQDARGGVRRPAPGPAAAAPRRVSRQTNRIAVAHPGRGRGRAARRRVGDARGRDGLRKIARVSAANARAIRGGAAAAGARAGGLSLSAYARTRAAARGGRGGSRRRRPRAAPERESCLAFAESFKTTSPACRRGQNHRKRSSPRRRRCNY